MTETRSSDPASADPATSDRPSASGPERGGNSSAGATTPGLGATTPGAGASTTASPATGPLSILSCPHCGKKNKIRPSPKGTPHCGDCGKPLPWVVEGSDSTFDVESRASVAVLVDLWAPWCGPCRVVGPIVEQLAQEYAGRLKVIKVNVDDNPALARHFRAMSIPTLVILRDGRVVDRIVGAMPKPDLKMRLFPHLLRT